MSIRGRPAGMRTSRKIASAIALLFIGWIAWCAKGPATIDVVPAQSLPLGFIWGVSSSAYQSEGGRLDSNWQRHNDATPEQDRYGTSVDFRHRYREDVALAKDLGVNTYRIGIDWARVEPKKGQIDEAEMAYYDDLILAIRQAGIAPLITLDHFVYPGWVADQGGWSNPQTVADFVAYSRRIAERYHGDVHLWFTFNEAAIYILQEKSLRQLNWDQTLQVRDHIVAAHRQVHDLIHGLDAKAMVTSNFYWMGDGFGSAPVNAYSDWLFLDRALDKCDVIAIDYYAASIPDTVRAGKQWNWPPAPAGLYRALKLLQAKYPDKPLLVAETGMATHEAEPRSDGVKREDVVRDSVYWTQRARQDGVKVIGYMVWSLTDNFEWGSYTSRFGLYTVNVLKDPELKRIPTAAVAAYREVIGGNGVAPDYRPLEPQ